MNHGNQTPRKFSSRHMILHAYDLTWLALLRLQMENLAGSRRSCMWLRLDIKYWNLILIRKVKILKAPRHMISRVASVHRNRDRTWNLDIYPKPSIWKIWQAPRNMMIRVASGHRIRDRAWNLATYLELSNVGKFCRLQCHIIWQDDTSGLDSPES